MTKLIWHTTRRKVNDLLPYVKNPRSISEKQMSDLKKSLKRFNLVELPAVDVDGKIVAGHQRIRALQILGRGDELIETRVPNRKLTQKEYDQYLITSNVVGGDWDFSKLKSFNLDMLVDVGFNKSELEDVWNEHLEVEGDDFDETKELAKIKIPKTKLGDVIELGPHKIICGDSTNPETIQKLFGQYKASMIYSDPVYNLRGGVDYAKGVGGRANYGGNVNDNRTDEEYRAFIKKSLENALAVSKKDVHVFYWCDQKYIWLIQMLYRELGIQNKRVCLWIKNAQSPTPGVAFSKCHEPNVYGLRGRPFISKNLQNLNEVMNKEITTGNSLLEETLDHLDVWTVKRLPGKQYEHATSKPPKLHEKALRRCTRPGEIILDSFLGSASTLIAAEQLKRRVFGVELEPIFCDLAIRRYEKLTGQKVKIIHHHEEE